MILSSAKKSVHIDVIGVNSDIYDQTMNIAIIDYPDVLKSAVYGLREMFLLANRLCAEHQFPKRFDVDIIRLDNMVEKPASGKVYTAVFLPPGMESNFYLAPLEALTNWLAAKHAEGSILCSACAGAFLIAPTGLLDGRKATTHWRLVNTLCELYPEINLNPDKIIINDGDIITAGGMMSWLDLGLELVEQLTSPHIMRQLGKLLVVDTGAREQRFYQQFSPLFTHGDDEILNAQKTLQIDYGRPVKVSALATASYLTERTFLRRFVKATGMKPSEYIQRLRVQKACDLLENTKRNFETIANEVGYEDTSACRKTFVKIMGLTPREFKKRFVGN